MDNFLKMINIQSVLFLYMLVGIYVRRKGILTDHARDKITDLLVDVLLPCMIFDSFNMEFTMDTLYQSGTAITTAASVAAVALLLGKVLYNNCEPRKRTILRYGTLVTNSGFAGLPVLSSMYGAQGLLIGSMFIIPNRILVWSAGTAMFTQDGGGSPWAVIKKVAKHPSLIAVYLGLIRMFTQLPMPSFVDKAVDGLGGCTSPLALMLVGSILADVEVKDVVEGKIFYMIFVRQILLPGLGLVVLRALNVDP
ncbi:MAG: AEC family transporter, partial [Faecalibacterium sp.]|nr:AEC family transporter [Faecalibacterium sp.]